MGHRLYAAVDNGTALSGSAHLARRNLRCITCPGLVDEYQLFVVPAVVGGGTRALPAGMLEAIYRRGFELLKDAITGPAANADPGQAIIAIATAYRRFALGNPALYALMFERPLPGFDPSPQLRSWALNLTFTPLVEQVARAQEGGLLVGDDPIRPSYLLWTTVHGVTSIELTHAVRSPLPGWFIDSPEAGEQILLEAVRAVLTGLH